jgi:hypothetical protein
MGARSFAVILILARFFVVSEEGGQLTTKLAKYPNAVVLIDEVEKVRIMTFVQAEHLTKLRYTSSCFVSLSLTAFRAWGVHVNVFLCFLLL